MRVFCCDTVKAFDGLEADVAKILLYSRTNEPGIGTIGTPIREYLNKHGYLPHPRAFDLVSLGLSVFAADEVVHRSKSPDGWTREIELTVSVSDPVFWNAHKDLIDSAFGFLTTDVWSINFIETNEKQSAVVKANKINASSVSLLSGGMDSLIGAIDLAAEKEKVLLVSQVANGDTDKQKAFATELGLEHIQLTHAGDFPGINESSTRSRSIIFLSYGVMAASLTDAYGKGAMLLRVPENGFMSINPPLTDSRIGSLSTRTTNPVFLDLLQRLLIAAGIDIRIVNPYQFKTKGEMLRECKNREYIRGHAHESTSCGRYQRMQYQHCGRCVPCLVRRASMHAASIADSTSYKYLDLAKDDAEHSQYDDVRSAMMAYISVKTHGLSAWLGASLALGAERDLAAYRSTVDRGINEIGAYLVSVGVK